MALSNREGTTSTSRQLDLIVVPLLLAITLFALNSLGILSGWLYPPDGYVPALIPRGRDFAQYLTWLGAFQDRAFISNYHAPWETEPALFNPVLWALGRSSHFLGIELVTGYHVLH